MLAPDILPLASLLPLSRATSPFDFTASSANLTAEWRNRFRAGPLNVQAVPRSIQRNNVQDQINQEISGRV